MTGCGAAVLHLLTRAEWHCTIYARRASIELVRNREALVVLLGIRVIGCRRGHREDWSRSG